MNEPCRKLQATENSYHSRNVENFLRLPIHVPAKNTDFNKSADICTITITITTTTNILVQTLQILTAN
jgi:hypothetical protein